MRLICAARFRRMRGCGVAAAVLAAVLGGLSVASPVISPASADASTGTGGEFVPVQGRILDTRQASSVGPYTSQMPVNQWRTVQVTGQRGIPTTGVAAVALNFTALNDTAAGYLKADKDETTPNDTSTYLFWNGGNAASTNSGVVAVGSDGKIQVKAMTSTTDLVIDVQGYYTSGDPTAGGFVPVPESRLVDTRSGTGLPAAPLASGSTTTVQVTGSAGVPADASAVMVNFLVQNQTGGGSVIPYPAGGTKPTQKLAFDATDSDSTTSAVGLSAGGALDVNLEINGAGSTDLVIDVLGYFTASEPGGAFTPAEARVYDSRTPANKLAAGATRTVQIAGVQGVPSTGIGAVMTNIDIFDTGGTAGGWTHVWPDDQTEPDPSMAVQYGAGESASNLMTVALGSDGGIKIHNLGSDAIDFAVDVEGWYSPVAPDSIGGSTMCASPSLTGCSQADLTTLTEPALVATTADPYGAALTYTFQVWNSDGVSPVSLLSSSVISNVLSGDEAVYEPTLSDGATYEYRVTASNGVAATAWSPWHVFSVSTSGTGGPPRTVLADANSGDQLQVANDGDCQRVSVAVSSTSTSGLADAGTEHDLSYSMDSNCHVSLGSGETVSSSDPAANDQIASGSEADSAISPNAATMADPVGTTYTNSLSAANTCGWWGNVIHGSQTLQDIINIDIAKYQYGHDRNWNACQNKSHWLNRWWMRDSTSVSWNHPKKPVSDTYDTSDHVSKTTAFGHGSFHTDFLWCNLESKWQNFSLHTELLSYANGNYDAIFWQKNICPGTHMATRQKADLNRSAW